MPEAPPAQKDTQWVRGSWCYLVKESTFLNISFLVVWLASGQQKKNVPRSPQAHDIARTPWTVHRFLKL